MTDLATPISTNRYGYVASAVCKTCRHIGELDLPALIARGLGDHPLIELPLVCADCGARGHTILVDGSRGKRYWRDPTVGAGEGAA